MRARSFSHVGITVRDFNTFVRFYWDVFGCPLVGVADTPPERVKAFFAVDGPAPRCKIGWIRVPGGAVLEIFHFEPQQPVIDVPWNRVGQTHFSLNVRNTQRWHDYLVSKGVEIVSRPLERSPRGHTFFFARDCDGNLIELMDLGYMHHVLNRLGPLGGWLFRRGMYKQYYQPQVHAQAHRNRRGPGCRCNGPLHPRTPAPLHFTKGDYNENPRCFTPRQRAAFEF